MIRALLNSVSAKSNIVILIALFLVWFFVAKLITNYYVEWRVTKAFDMMKEDSQESFNEFQLVFDRFLGVLHSVPLILSRDTDIIRVLKGKKDAVSSEDGLTTVYKNNDERQLVFARLNESLVMLTGKIPAVSTIWVLDRNGRVVLSGAARDKKKNFVGNDFSSLPCFRMPMNGQAGLQYVADRKAGQQGICFSSPVMDEGRVIGVVAVRIEMAYLSDIIHHVNGFLVDRSGVVVEAKNKSFLLTALPDSTVLEMPDAERMLRYGKKNFDILPMSPWRDGAKKGIVSFQGAERPSYIRSFDLLPDELRLMLVREPPFLVTLMFNGMLSFTIILLGGWLCILVGNFAVFQIRSHRILALSKKRQEALERIATHDVLTGVYSRSATENLFGRAVAHARESSGKFAVLFVDLDFFRDINDTYGHAFGDEALSLVGRRIKGSLRKSDIIIRYGGDEFLVLLNDFRQDEDVSRIAGNVLAEIEKVMVIQNTPVKLSASIGIALFPDDGETLAELVQCADKALYDVKNTSRARFAFYSSMA